MIRFMMAMAVFVALAISTAQAEDLAATTPQTNSEVTAPAQDTERSEPLYRNTRERWRGAPYVNEDRKRALDFRLPPLNSLDLGNQALISF